MAILGEALSRADATWFHADVPTNHFVVTSVALVDRPVEVARLKKVLAARIALHPRLTQVVADTSIPLAARWVKARDFDLDAHVHHVALPQPATRETLATFVGDLAGQPLDPARPLWQLFVVDGPGEGGAIVSRLHHALGDGYALVRMLLSLTDDTPGGWSAPPPPPRKAPSRRSRKAADGFAPFDIAGAAPRLVRKAVDAVGTLARLTLADAEHPTPLRGELSLLKGVAWTDPMDLDAVKRVAGASGTKVNDVIVSAIAGGLGSYLREAGLTPNGLRLHALVPVNVRPPEDTRAAGNEFSLVFLELPVGVTGAWERLMKVKIEMDRIKASMETWAGWVLVRGLGFLPAALEHRASGFYADKASLILTNVIGPPKRIYMAGRRIEQMAFWVPESGGLGVGMSIYSYAGQVTVGLIADRKLVAEPQRITAGVERAFEQLVAESL